jgi:DNA (cytosine-5)-methyltransferase 1
MVSEDPPEVAAPSPRFIDLFCGIGGFRIAFEKAGGRCVFSSDYDKFSQQTYGANFGERPHGDIHVAVADIPAHDILCGGFPCQPFSLAGVSKKLSLGHKHGFDDVKQGNLFFSIADILDFHRPAAFVLENVKNLKGHDGGKTFEIIHGTLSEALGYTVYHKIIDAQSVVPQHRERIFFVGFREWSLRLSENGGAMLGKKRQVRRRGIIGKVQRLSRIRAEVLGDAALR